MHTKKTIALLGIIVVTAVLCWSLWHQDKPEDVDNSMNSGASKPATTPRRKPDNKSKMEPRSSAEVGRPLRLKLSDRVTGRPVPELACTVKLNDTIYNDESDSRGMAVFPGITSGDAIGVSIRLPQSLGNVEVRRTVKCSETDEFIEVLLDIYCRIHIVVSDSRNSMPECHVDALSYPLVSPIITDYPEIEPRLRGLHGSPIALFDALSALRKRGRIDLPLVQRRATYKVGKPQPMDIAYAGRVALVANAPGRVNSINVIEIEPGQELEVSMLLKESPWVSGRLLDENKRPIGGEKVNVGAVSHFGDSEVNARVRQNATAITTKRGTPGYFVTTIKHTTTNSKGEFRVAMPYTDRVGVWTSVSGCEIAYEERTVDSREESVENVVLRLKPADAGQVVMRTFVDQKPERVAFVISVKGNPFRIRSMQVSSSDAGVIDLSFLEEGGEYVAFPIERSRLEAVKFVCNDGGRIAFPLR